MGFWINGEHLKATHFFLLFFQVVSKSVLEYGTIPIHDANLLISTLCKFKLYVQRQIKSNFNNFLFPLQLKKTCDQLITHESGLRRENSFYLTYSNFARILAATTFKV